MHAPGPLVTALTTGSLQPDYEQFLQTTPDRPIAQLRASWRKTWLFDWLSKNATATFSFHPLKSEEWHWDYK